MMKIVSISQNITFSLMCVLCWCFY